jgi:hypothetical protein
LLQGTGIDLVKQISVGWTLIMSLGADSFRMNCKELEKA